MVAPAPSTPTQASRGTGPRSLLSNAGGSPPSRLAQVTGNATRPWLVGAMAAEEVPAPFKHTSTLSQEVSHRHTARP